MVFGGEWFLVVEKKNELKKPTCLLGDEKPMDTSDRIYELYLILRRRSQELADHGLSLGLGPRSASGFPGRLTRDSYVVSLEIPGCRKIGKIWKIGFLNSRDQNKNLTFFLMWPVFLI